MRGFNDLIMSLSLIQPPITGRSCTWTSDWQLSTSAKLDMFLFSLEWEEQFSGSSACGLPRFLSDHISILFDTGETIIPSSIFRFENMCSSYGQFNSDVWQFWCSLSITHVIHGARLVLKLDISDPSWSPGADLISLMLQLVRGSYYHPSKSSKL